MEKSSRVRSLQRKSHKHGSGPSNEIKNLVTDRRKTNIKGRKFNDLKTSF